jgi:hypothetical protein
MTGLVDRGRPQVDLVTELAAWAVDGDRYPVRHRTYLARQLAALAGRRPPAAPYGCGAGLEWE